jgi:phospholipid/cholesterol/gamma-HCH transport system substrate-binding protein
VSVPAEDRRRAIGFLVASAVLLALVLVAIGARRFAREERTVFALFSESVSGLEASSVVTFKGVPIGFVRDIQLRPGSLDVVAVELGLRKDIPIKVDTRAQLKPQGITGAYQLQLDGGSPDAPELAEGGTITATPSILSTAGATLEDVAVLARDLRDSGAQVEAVLEELRRALVSVRAGADTATATVAAIGTDVHAGIESLRATTEDVRAVVADPAWRSIGPALLAAIEDLRRATATLDRAAASVAAIGEESRDDVRAILAELRRASGHVRGAAGRVRDSPSSLLFDRAPPEKAFPDPLPDPHEEAP